MRANANLCIRGQRVLLVPYRREHVELYHRWMQDPVLQVRGWGRGSRSRERAWRPWSTLSTCGLEGDPAAQRASQGRHP